MLLQITEDDITNNIEIICPTNYYSKDLYNPKRRTFFLMKRGEYYEPIYSFTDNIDSITVQKTFTEYGHLPQNIRNSIHIIREHIENNCTPLNSQPDIYYFKENIVFERLLDEIKK